MEYLCVQEEKSEATFIMLVKKGYNKERGFFGIERIQKDFKKCFRKAEVASAKRRELNDEFQGILKRAMTDFSKELRDTPDDEIELMNMMSGCVTRNLEMMLERDRRVTDILSSRQVTQDYGTVGFDMLQDKV